MKTLITLLLVSFSLAAAADQFVRGYTRNDGTYVPPYYRSSPNSTAHDNYSTYGNYNPYTGQPGYAQPEYYLRDENGTPYRYKRY